MISQLAKTMAVIVSSTILATLAVNAVDMRGQLAHTFLGSLFYATSEEVVPCPPGMALVTNALEPFCVDVYEASASEACMYDNPAVADETKHNLADAACAPESVAGAMPWRHVSQHDAQLACTRAGKRLPTASEWHKSALGTQDVFTGYQDDHCNVARNREDGVAPTGGGMRCVSEVGAYDMIGNVWEWVAEEVVKGQWQGRAVPRSGYVAGADMHGVAYATDAAPSDTFQYDRFWSDSELHAGMMRGGYYDSTSNAGLYAVYAASPPEFAGEAVGFRCAMAPQNLSDRMQ